MATVVQGKDMKGPPNQTLEDVAEEVLNGMFCHYEPRQEEKKKRRGILRTPKMFRRPKPEQERQPPPPQDRNVRWSDKVEKSYPKPPSMDGIQCNVASVCVDACGEAGIVSSPTKKARVAEIASRLDYDKLKKKPKRQVSISKSTSSDDTSSKQSNSTRSSKSRRSSDSSEVPPPPPPPPPPKQETGGFCGAIEITCGENGEAPEILSVDATNKPYHRPTQKYDYVFDEDNSLIEEADSDEDQTSNRRKKKDRRKMSLRRSSGVGRKNSKNKALFEGSDSGTSDWEEAPDRKKKGADDATYDAISSVRSDDDLNENENPKKSKKATTDWDDSVPIVKGNSKAKAQSTKNVLTASSHRSKKKERRSLSPGRRSRSRSPKNRLSLDSGKEQSASRLSAFHPAHPLSKGGADKNSSTPSYAESFITAHRRGFGDNMSSIGQPPPPPPKDSDAALDDMVERQSYITANRQGLDVAMMRPNNANHVDDRQSYITAHRREMESPRQRLQRKQRGRSPSRRGRSSSPMRRSRSPGRRGRSMSGSPRGRSMSPGPWMYPNVPPGMMMMPNGMYAPPYPVYQMQQPPQGASYGKSPQMVGPYPQPMQNAQIQGISHQALPHFYSADQSIVSSINEGYAEQQHQEGDNLVELSWEERTRQAWERLRNGVVESLSSECSKGDVSDDTEKDLEAQIPTPPPGSILQSPSFQRDQPSNPMYQLLQSTQQHPVSILRSNGPERRVTFGPPSQQVYEDDQDENDHTETSKRAFKKKMRFRGRKLLSGLFGRNRRHEELPTKSDEYSKEFNLTQSQSVDVTASNSASTEEWDETMSQSDPAVRQHMQYPMPYYQPFYPPAPMGNNNMYGVAAPTQQMPLQQVQPQAFYGFPVLQSESPSPAPPVPSGYYLPQAQQASPGFVYNQ